MSSASKIRSAGEVRPGCMCRDAMSVDSRCSPGTCFRVVSEVTRAMSDSEMVRRVAEGTDVQGVCVVDV